MDPEIIHLGVNAQCACGAKFNPAHPIFRASCTVYCLTRTVSAEIELQTCPSCKADRRQFIGPDGRECGLFNLNNRSLFSHDLLDEYMSAFSGSATPFVAWVSSKNNIYMTYDSPKPFATADIFRATWFGYVQLQNFSNDLTCTICGSHPEEIIWDGVTIAFKKDKILPSLQPPTMTSDESPIRNEVRNQPNQRLIKDRDTRKQLRNILQCYRRAESDGQHGETGNISDIPDSDFSAAQVEEELRAINVGLGDLFAERVGSSIYYDLFYQVRFFIKIMYHFACKLCISQIDRLG